MGEDVQEEAAVGLQPCAQSNHQFAPVHHVFEHLDGEDAVEPRFRREQIHVRRGDVQIRQATLSGFALDIFTLRVRVGNR